MTTIKLDNIPEYQNKITFHNDRLQTMLSNVKEYANVRITYNDFSKRIEREGSNENYTTLQCTLSYKVPPLDITQCK